MKKFFTLLIPVIIAGTVILIILGSFRYKNYLYSDYVFMLKDSGKVYKFENKFQIVGDRITGEQYLLLGLGQNWTYGNEVRNMFMIANSNYEIENTDSKFYDGILQMCYSGENPVNLEKVEKEINLHKKESTEKVEIRYNGKTGSFTLTEKNENPEFKSFRFWICSKRYNGYSCGTPKGYGISFKKLKEDFGLNLGIEVDNREKIVYFIKE